MGIVNEVLRGYAVRIRMENSLQLQKAKIVRPKQIKVEVSVVLNDLEQQLKDPELRAIFDTLDIKVPDDIV